MPFFPNRDYASDATQFLDALKNERKYLEAAQQAGRAILWDKPLGRSDRELEADFAKAEVTPKAYPYQAAPRH